MCVWGEAFALGPNLNSGDDEFLLKSVPLAFQRAYAAKDMLTTQNDNQEINYTDLEIALVSALTFRYVADLSEYYDKRSLLDFNFAVEMNRVAERYPTDDNVLTISANAWMNTRPWDYWETPTILYNEGKMAKDLLEKALNINPNNTYAIHLYIHVTEASASFGLAVPFADRLMALAPSLPHLQHMPSHTYLHTGDWSKAAEGNAAAWKLGSLQIYPEHNLECLIWPLRMEGSEARALEASFQLFEVATEEGGVGYFSERLASSFVLTQAVFSRWDDVLENPAPPPDSHFWCLLWHYARGLAWLSPEKKNVVNALVEYTALQQQYDAIYTDHSTYGGVSVRRVSKIAKLILESRFAAICSKEESEIEFLRLAWETEKNLPYSEPPIWTLPVGHTLGASLIRYGRTDEARSVYEDVLKMYPNDGWALYGKSKISCGNTFDVFNDTNWEWENLSIDCEQDILLFKEAWAHADVFLFDSGTVLSADSLIRENRNPGMEPDFDQLCEQVISEALQQTNFLILNTSQSERLPFHQFLPILFCALVLFIITLVKIFRLKSHHYFQIS